jgi:hypothetical protein
MYHACVLTTKTHQRLALLKSGIKWKIQHHRGAMLK